MVIFGRYIRYQDTDDFNNKLEKTNSLINLFNLNESEYKIINYFDKKCSGKDDTRNNFNKMIKDIKKGKFNILVSPSINNISRNCEMLGKILYELNNNKMRIITKDLDLSGYELDVHSKIYNLIFKDYQKSFSNHNKENSKDYKVDDYEL